MAWLAFVLIVLAWVVIEERQKPLPAPDTIAPIAPAIVVPPPPPPPPPPPTETLPTWAQPLVRDDAGRQVSPAPVIRKPRIADKAPALKQAPKIRSQPDPAKPVPKPEAPKTAPKPAPQIMIRGYTCEEIKRLQAVTPQWLIDKFTATATPAEKAAGKKCIYGRGSVGHGRHRPNGE